MKIRTLIPSSNRFARLLLVIMLASCMFTAIGCCMHAASSAPTPPTTPPATPSAVSSAPRQITDLSGHGHVGTPGTGFEGASAPMFNGSFATFTRYSDTIHLEGNVTLSSQATYEATVRITQTEYSAHGDNGMIWNVSTDNLQDTRLAIQDGGQVAAFSYPVNNGNVMKSGTLQTGVWYNLAYVYDGSQERVYINGKLVDARPAAGSISIGAGNMTLAAIFRNGSVINGFQGDLASVRISDTARYAGETYNAIAGPGVFSNDAHAQALYSFALMP